jgi:hypothetical protein
MEGRKEGRKEVNWEFDSPTPDKGNEKKGKERKGICSNAM